MIRSKWIVVTLVIVGMVAVSPCHASFEVSVGDIVKLRKDNPPTAGGPGGIFHADVLYEGTTLDFDTFCVELTEHISLNTEYYVQSVDKFTVGGIGQTVRHLTSKAAWLYTQFDELDNNATNGLAGFNFTNPTTNMANALQLGLWRELNPGWSNTAIAGLPNPWTPGYITTLETTYLNTWMTNYQNDVDDGLWSANGTGDVYIMSLRKFVVSQYGTITLADGRKIKLKDQAQDQLVRLPPPDQHEIVPELTTFCMASSVLAGAAVYSLVVGQRRRPTPAGNAL